jgi:hypothetical protein
VRHCLGPVAAFAIASGPGAIVTSRTSRSPEEQPLPAVTAPGTPPILAVSTTNDPATPHDAAVRAPDRLESAVLLTVEGDRHDAVSGGIACVDEHVAHYLVNVIPPPESTVCAAD